MRKRSAAIAYMLLNKFLAYLDHFTLLLKKDLYENQYHLSVNNYQLPELSKPLPVAIIQESITLSDHQNFQLFSLLEEYIQSKCGYTNTVYHQRGQSDPICNQFVLTLITLDLQILEHSLYSFDALATIRIVLAQTKILLENVEHLSCNSRMKEKQKHYNS
ncbi:hypothetical protein FGO68_gene13541 [Halteria grandinella]|uniref:Uncharacterized protein n=1 Tax=Halteria grandinella TaxID=5974 RepID=A0A8J8NH84_HALGN|nr:hypothetical protein FGO68_gene13541 [Halteria grandinella]